MEFLSAVTAMPYFNEFLWFSFMVFDLSVTVLVYRYFGKSGLFALIPFNLILCNIQVLKLVNLLGFETTLGNILYTSVFLTSNMLCEFHGKKAARTGVCLGFVMLVLSTIYMQVALLYIPSAHDTMQATLSGIFSFLPRLAFASLCAYLVSQLHDVWAFHFWRSKTSGRHLWLRNGASTLVSQFLDSAIFCLLAFYGVEGFHDVLAEILFTTFLFKAIVSCLDTPFIYLARLAHRGRVKAGLERDEAGAAEQA